MILMDDKGLKNFSVWAGGWLYLFLAGGVRTIECIEKIIATALLLHYLSLLSYTLQYSTLQFYFYITSLSFL